MSPETASTIAVIAGGPRTRAIGALNVTAPAFACLALLLTGPIPDMLARATWPHRTPRAALVLWQAIALAAVLSAFGSGLAITSELLVPGPDGKPTASPASQIRAIGLPLWIADLMIFAITLLVGARLCYTVIRVGIRTRRRRARHRMLVDLLDPGSTHPGRALSPEVRVLSTARPMAYCLPGRRRRVVLSEGTLANLGAGEISAILGHERSHLRARHDLVLEAFTTVHQAFPRFVRSASALGAARLLVELLADDSAVRASGPRQLARALVTCADSTAPVGALAAGGTGILIRVQRLATHNRRGAVPIAVAAYLASVLILAVPTLAVAVPWLVELHRLIAARG